MGHPLLVTRPAADSALGVADPRQASEGEGRDRQHAVTTGGRVRAERWTGVGRFWTHSFV